MYTAYHHLLEYARRRPVSESSSKREDIFSMLSPDILKSINFSGVEHLKLMPSVVITSILINLLTLVMPLTVIQVYDRIIANSANETLAVLTVMLLCVGIIEGILNALRTYFLSRSGLGFRFASEISALRRMLCVREGKIANEHPARLTQRIEAVGHVADFYGSVTRILYLDLPFCALFLGMIWIIGGWLFLVPLAVLILYILTARYIGDSFGKVLKGKETVDTDLQNYLSEVFSNLRNIRSMGIEANMQRRFEAINERAARINNYMSISTILKESSATTLSSFSSIATICIGAIFAINGDLSVGSLVACSILSGRIIQPVVRFSKEWFDLKRIRNALEETKDVFALPLPYNERVSQPQGGLDIKFENVRFSPQMSEHIRCHIKSGQLVVIKGNLRVPFINSVVGKQSLYHGVVFVDNVLPHMCRRENGTIIAHYNLQTKPWFASVIENLTMFYKAADIVSARAVCRMIGLEKEIDLMSSGYETVLDEAVRNNLSPGFMQRLMIARVLCQRANVIVLDDPTAKLTIEEKEGIVKALKLMKRDATVLISTVDPIFDDIADEILTFSHIADQTPSNGGGL
jgi:ATP-binding cassette, subfamily C, bacterial LapB